MITFWRTLMKVTATVTDVLRNFSDYINRVNYRGERFVLTRGGKEVAELGPAPRAGRPLSELPGVLVSLPRLGEDEAAYFGEDLERVRAELAARSTEDPWGS
jgi:antitoxin (DNA-binding transcriptional repressor) of toxin-antitoxin stability system